MVIADGMNNRLQAVNLSDQPQVITGLDIYPGEMITIAGKGPSCLNAKDSLSPCNIGFGGDGDFADNAIINWPFAPRFDRSGRVWFIDANNNRIRVIDETGRIYSIGGNAPLLQSEGFRYMGSIDRDIGDGRPPSEADFNRPMDMVVIDKGNNLYDIIVSDTDNNRIRLIHDYMFPYHNN